VERREHGGEFLARGGVAGIADPADGAGCRVKLDTAEFAPDGGLAFEEEERERELRKASKRWWQFWI
jgi:hypothetical protein